jgi:hypothetical protein
MNMTNKADDTVFIVVEPIKGELRNGYPHEWRKSRGNNPRYILNEITIEPNQIAFASRYAASYYAGGILEVYRAEAANIRRVDKNSPLLLCNSIRPIKHIKTKRFAEYWAECNF